MDFKAQLEQIAISSNELDVRMRHTNNKDIQELSSYFRKMCLSYNEILRAYDVRLRELEQNK